MSRMDINSKTVTFGSKMLATRNISEASSWKNERGKPDLGQWFLAILLILGGIGFVGQTPASLIAVAIGALMIWGFVTWRPTYELQLQTNAGKVTAFASQDEKFIDLIISKLYAAIHEPNSAVNYQVNIDAKTVQENTISVAGSTGVNVIGGDGGGASQTAIVSGPTLADINQLIALIQSSAAPDQRELQATLEEVRNYMAGGGRSKAEAQASWQNFIQRIGSIADTGPALWDLVGKISKLFV